MPLEKNIVVFVLFYLIIGVKSLGLVQNNFHQITSRSNNEENERSLIQSSEPHQRNDFTVSVNAPPQKRWVSYRPTRNLGGDPPIEVYNFPDGLTTYTEWVEWNSTSFNGNAPVIQRTSEIIRTRTKVGPDGKLITEKSSTGPRTITCTDGVCPEDPNSLRKFIESGQNTPFKVKYPLNPVDTYPAGSPPMSSEDQPIFFNPGAPLPFNLNNGLNSSNLEKDHPTNTLPISSGNVENLFPMKEPVVTASKDDESKRICQISLTKINGAKPVCSGALIFNSEFSDGKGRDWSHTVRFPDEEDDENEFTILDRDPKNTYSENGSLVLKPSFLDDSHNVGFATYGKLDLMERCTAHSTRDCNKAAVGGQILPPILSARITTKDSFSFTYGILEVKAKLPRGDWVVPEIWLVPKKISYGENSGKIVIMHTRGNDDLKYKGIDLGNKHCNTMLKVGNHNSNCTSTATAGTMADGYGLFKIIWQPDVITVFNGDKQFCSWSANDNIFLKGKEDKIAPFNKFFYISLGVHVGGVPDFPDGCLNRGKPKPWKNNGSKRRKTFYDDSKNWLKTWDDETALKIEHVKVWAL